jgi:3-methylfumaryl-CoA hydratase
VINSNDGAIESEDYSAWVLRSQVLEDVASAAAAVQLAGLLDGGGEVRLDDAGELFPLGHWLQFTPTEPRGNLGDDGHPKLGGFMPPVSLPRRMWAGSKITFHSPIKVGDGLSRTTTIESVTPKTGSSGRLCFVVLRHDVIAGGEHALTEHQTIVYREAVPVDANAPFPQRPPRKATEAPDGWDWFHAVTPDEITLFRYSALTYNSHRIHYDLPYATGIEGYPGLVVHGPLSASFIVSKFLQERPGARITAFDFSARSPVFANEQMHICGVAGAGNTEQLAVIAPGGQPAVTARIDYC